MQDTKVEFDSENSQGKCPGYIIKGTKPYGLIVLSEWWGANEQIREQAAEYASNYGYTTLVPDLYRGKVAIDHEEAGHLFKGLDWVGAVKDIAASAKYLRETVGCKKIAVTGFCMGGALALATVAIYQDSCDIAIPFYGIPKDELCDVTKIKVPLQLHFGTEDASKGFSAPHDQDVLEKKLNDAGISYEFYRYEGAKHAFAHKGGPNYDEKAINLAVERMFSFMEKHFSEEK